MGGGAGAESTAAVRVDASALAYAYDASLPPAATVDPGTVLVVETADARGGALADRAAGSLFELPPPPVGGGNPLTGPIAVRGATPGEALVVDLLAVECGPLGWAGAHAHVNPLARGRIPLSLGRSCAVGDGRVAYSDAIELPLRPMVGCLGTAPAGAAPYAGDPGRHGGNLDHSIVAAGSRVYLPVAVDGACLFVGDVHATQGDGELSGVALEIPAEVTLRVGTAPVELDWPWVETRDRISVLVAAAEFADARREAVDAMLALVERRLGLAPADGLALVSVAGDLRVGQAFGGMDLTLRLELPRLPGLALVGAER